MGSLSFIAYGTYLEEGSSQYPKGHQLVSLWSTARTLIERIGPVCTDDDLDAMTHLVNQLSAIDPGSLAFRYPINKDGSPSLPPSTEFNLAKFREGIEKMAGFFDGARSMLHEFKSIKDSLR